MPKPTPLEDGEVDEWLSSHITHAVSTLKNETDGFAGGNGRTGKSSLGLR